METQPPQKGHGNPPLLQFTDVTAAYVYCGQMVRWIRMPLVREAGLGPGDIVLDGDPTPHGKRHSSPHFSAHFAVG